MPSTTLIIALGGPERNGVINHVDKVAVFVFDAIFRDELFSALVDLLPLLLYARPVFVIEGFRPQPRVAQDFDRRIAEKLFHKLVDKKDLPSGLIR